MTEDRKCELVDLASSRRAPPPNLTDEERAFYWESRAAMLRCALLGVAANLRQLGILGSVPDTLTMMAGDPIKNESEIVKQVSS
jgi:hypothetical protein